MQILQRNILKELEEWNIVLPRTPLVIFGPRQTGKSFLTRKVFAQKYFKNNHHIIDFFTDSKDKQAPRKFAKVFEQTGDINNILQNLNLLLDTEIDTDNDLLIFDEIQECVAAYESLKQFKEEYPNLRIICTGSYLQLFLRQNSDLRHPLGCTTELRMGPLSFLEFLKNYKPLLFKKYQEIDIRNSTAIDESTHQLFLEALNLYFFTGGMPEVVSIYLNNYKTNLRMAVKSSTKKKSDLLLQHYRDLDKYSDYYNVKKLKKIFTKIAIYLEKHNEESVERFQFKKLDDNKNYRFRDLEHEFAYLRECGLIIQSNFTNNPTAPLTAHIAKSDRNIFKCYLFDIGLLNQALNTPYNIIDNKSLGYYKGYIAENFVAQQIFHHSSSDELFCYKKKTNIHSAEIEFIISFKNLVIPIEVKSSSKFSKAKSLNSYIKDFAPKEAYKCSPHNIGKGSGFISIPLYLVEKIFS